jgi:UDP-N-acetylmuramoyl-tripeptide--D-alanyl-D-alanine ligase
MSGTARWTAEAAIAATGGTSTAPWTAVGVSIDSRTTAPGELFVALQGPRFDGHDFVAQAFARGAAAAMASG